MSFTHWTFDQLDAQDRFRLNQVMAYLEAKDEIQREKDRLDSSSKGKGTTGRGH